MKTDFDFPRAELLGPVAFRPSFNEAEKITPTQAWSLFFSAGQEDKLLGFEPEIGKFFTNTLIAIAITGVLVGSLFIHA
jgi:hypothetical protein